MSSSPDIDFVIHVIEVRRVVSESGCERSGPLTAVHAIGRVTHTRLIEQWEIHPIHLGGGSCERSRTVRFQRSGSVGGELIDFSRLAARIVLRDGKRPVIVVGPIPLLQGLLRALRYP